MICYVCAYRRFTYGHLAQLKYILPEAIVIKKVLLRDEATSCMKPELHVTLQVDSFEDEVMRKGENGYSVLRRVFRERLEDFSKRHPEVTKICSSFIFQHTSLMTRHGNW